MLIVSLQFLKFLASISSCLDFKFPGLALALLMPWIRVTNDHHSAVTTDDFAVFANPLHTWLDLHSVFSSTTSSYSDYSEKSEEVFLVSDSYFVLPKQKDTLPLCYSNSLNLQITYSDK